MSRAWQQRLTYQLGVSMVICCLTIPWAPMGSLREIALWLGVSFLQGAVITGVLTWIQAIHRQERGNRCA